MTFPVTRPRRLRRREGLRRLVRETSLDPAQFVLPLFVVPGSGVRRPLQSLPGVAHVSPDEAAAEAARAAAAGVGGVLLFGLPATKDEQGSSAWDDAGPVPEAIRAIRAAAPELVIATDVCLCAYTTPRPLRRPGARRPRAQRRDAAAARQHGGGPRAGRRRPDRAVGHDGRPHRRRPRAPSTRPGSRRPPRSWPTRRSSPRPSTGRSARPPTPRRRTATAARTRWIPPTPWRACASRCSTWTRAPTC